MDGWLRGAVIGTGLALAACGEGASTPSKSKAAAEWQKLADGSDYSEVVGDAVSDAARCWPAKTGGAECIEVSVVRLPGIAPMTTVRASTRGELGQHFVPNAGSEWSYGCTYSGTIGVEEEISLAGSKLTSRVRSFEGRWPKSFVSAYVKDNNLRGRYFGCVDILDALNAGSFATMRTTSISQSMLQGR